MFELTIVVITAKHKEKLTQLLLIPPGEPIKEAVSGLSVYLCVCAVLGGSASTPGLTVCSHSQYGQTRSVQLRVRNHGTTARDAPVKAPGRLHPLRVCGEVTGVTQWKVIPLTPNSVSPGCVQ